MVSIDPNICRDTTSFSRKYTQFRTWKCQRQVLCNPSANWKLYWNLSMGLWMDGIILSFPLYPTQEHLQFSGKFVQDCAEFPRGRNHSIRRQANYTLLLRVGHDWATSLSLFTFMHWRRKWQPTPVFLPGESQGLGSLVGCCLWGHTVGHDWRDLAAAAAAATHTYVLYLPRLRYEHDRITCNSMLRASNSIWPIY